MTIAEVSKEYGLTADTLRYYEKVGLIPTVHRTPGGVRDYTEEDRRWVGFIKCMRGAGLPVEVLIEYVSLFKQGDKTIDARKELLIEQRRQLIAKMDDMQETLDRLNHKIDEYEQSLLKKERELSRYKRVPSPKTGEGVED